MRIRKRYQNPLPPPDLSSALPRSTVPSAARGTTAGGKEGEATAAAAAAVCAPGGGCGDAARVGKGLHRDGRTTGPSACPPPSARGAERGYLPVPGPRLLFDYGHHKVPKREQGGEIGDAHRGWNMDALRWDSGDATSPKSLGAEASEVSGGHGGGGKMLPSSGAAAVLAAAEAMMKCGVDEEGEFPLKKRRGGYHGRGRSLGSPEAEEEQEEEEKGGENVVIEREMKQRRRPSKTRRRRTAASTSATMVATGTVLTSAGTGNVGASTATAGDGAGEKCDDMVVKEEGGDVAAAALLVVGNRDSGSGKKRRSPAVLMEGSRCSRVNGRGWRCCQQTLVGYSLCEHHLGKGRLRSVSSVRCNGRARKKEDVGDHGAAAPPLPSPLRQQRDQVLSRDEEGEEEEKPGKRRRNKIGIVKARSISSLLHQPVHPAPTAIAAPEKPIFPSPSPQLQLHAQ